MIIEKILETQVDLKTPEEIYTIDIKSLLIKKLTDRYSNICFSGLLILDIVDIIRYSDRIMVDNRLDGAATITVQFKVNGILLTNGEVVQGFTVSNITSYGTVVVHPKIYGYLKQDPKKIIINIIKVNQNIPIIVNSSRYSVGSKKIGIDCVPYTPQPFNEIYYKITAILSMEETDKIDNLLIELKEEMTKHEKKITEKSYIYFQKIVFPYENENRKILEYKKFKIIPINLEALLKINSGIIVGTDYNTNDFLLHSHNEIKEDNIIIGPLYPALSSIILKKIQYMRMLREFSEYYDTPEKNASMLTYWETCVSIKKYNV